jgi:hypothetical protein
MARKETGRGSLGIFVRPDTKGKQTHITGTELRKCHTEGHVED